MALATQPKAAGDVHLLAAPFPTPGERRALLPWAAVAVSCLLAAAACGHPPTPPTSPATPVCTFNVANANQTIDASGGTVTFSVVVQNDCNWSAEAEPAAFLSIKGNTEHTVYIGPNTITAAITANPGRTRTGTVTLLSPGSQRIMTVVQDALNVPLPTAPSFLWYTSSYGDGVGQGESHVYVPGNWQSFVTNLLFLYVVASGPGYFFHFQIQAPLGQDLAVGTYTNVAPTPTATRPGMDFNVNSRGCGIDFPSNSFTILELEKASDGSVTRLHARFVQSCGILTQPVPPLTGEIWYVK